MFKQNVTLFEHV